MSCESAMKRIKREVDDFYGNAAAAAVAAPAATAAAPAATRGRSASRGPRVESNTTKAKRDESKSRLIAQGIAKPTAVQMAKEMSEMDILKLSPTSQPLKRDVVKFEGLYRKASDALKAMEAGKAVPKSEEGKSKEQLEVEKKAAQAAYQLAKKALEERAKAKVTAGGARSRKSRSRRASRKQRKQRKASRKSRRSMRR